MLEEVMSALEPENNVQAPPLALSVLPITVVPLV